MTLDSIQAQNNRISGRITAYILDGAVLDLSEVFGKDFCEIKHDKRKYSLTIDGNIFQANSLDEILQVSIDKLVGN